jgi:hypothetical protein
MRGSSAQSFLKSVRVAAALHSSNEPFCVAVVHAAEVERVAPETNNWWSGKWWAATSSYYVLSNIIQGQLIPRIGDPATSGSALQYVALLPSGCPQEQPGQTSLRATRVLVVVLLARDWTRSLGCGSLLLSRTTRHDRMGSILCKTK